MNKARTSYHHGNLRSALTDAAMRLAEEGGPEAVVLREAARHVGVSATAAYRHFANHTDLMHVIKERALEILTVAMEEKLAALPHQEDPTLDALARLRATGVGYVHFAMENPGIFRTWCNPIHDHEPTGGYRESRPFQVLVDVMNELRNLGLVQPEQPTAEVTAWAAVHGLAMLLLDGPLRVLPPEHKEAVIDSTLDVVVHGICRQLP